MKPLEISAGAWSALMRDLFERGGGMRESGAFLLGSIGDRTRTVRDWLPYDELDPAVRNFEYVRLETAAFTKLWEVCAARSLEVVADVHTHPLGPGQSISDRENPMISLAGHVALIVPYFARGDVQPADLSVNVYLGGGTWKSHYRDAAAALIQLIG